MKCLCNGNTLYILNIKQFWYISSENSGYCFEWNSFINLIYLLFTLPYIRSGDSAFAPEFLFNESTSGTWNLLRRCDIPVSSPLRPHDTTFYPRAAPWVKHGRPWNTLRSLPFCSLYPINILYPELYKYPNLTTYARYNKCKLKLFQFIIIAKNYWKFF